MEIRRVQMTGGSSFVITLPKEWVKSLNIKKNDPLGIYIQSDGTLLISSKMNQEPSRKIKEFNITNITQQTDILRRLIGAYITGYTSIHVTSKERIPSNIRSTIRQFTQLTIGQEVIEETDTTIIIKDLLNPIEMPFERTIKRMHIIIKGMHEDILRSLKTRDKQLPLEIILRDNEVDRLHWLISRQHNIILQNISLAEKMHLTIDLASTYFLISRIIERIGDHIVRIARNIHTLIEGNLDEAILDKIQEASLLAQEYFNKSIWAFFRKDIKRSNENIDNVLKLEALCEEINTLTLKQKGVVVIAIGYIVESIRRIGEYAEDIAENTINYVISEQ